MSAHRLSMIYRAPDLDRWRAVLERGAPADRTGLLSRRVFQSVDDPQEVMIQLDFTSAEAAAAFLPSLDLRGILDDIGVDVYPPVFIGTEVEDLRKDYT